ncbi:MAG: hypothetical protein ACREJO_00290 [Phycisphaerales bacterium]
MPHTKKHHRGHGETEPRYNRPRSNLMSFLYAGAAGIVLVLLAVWLINKLFY